jgi:FemAB-related protein (PEP-CTERM system-associated)
LVSNWIVGRCLISTPFADYGGVCAADEESADSLVAHALEIGTAEKVDFLELRHKTGKPRPEFYVKDLYVSFATELAAEPEAHLKRLPRDTRYMIRKGEKAGLEIQHGLEQLPEFYGLFTLNWRRFGTPVFSPQWLEVLIQEFQGSAGLVMARANGRPVAGVFSFVFRDTLFPHYSGAAPDANALAANNFIYWELMKRAIGQGVRRFDFGRSKQNTGAYKFKSAWNMQMDALQYQICMIKRRSPPNFSPANPKFALAANLWSRMPLKATTWLGPHVVRWFP